MTAARVRRHCLFGIISISIFTGFYLVDIDRFSPAHFIGISTAYASLVFFVAALVIGPIKLIQAKLIPVSSHLRRDLGIWSAVLALVHVVAGLLVHPFDRIWHYFIYPEQEAGIVPIRYDLFGLTNHLGLVCTVLMLILLLLSNNWSLRKLGAPRWKKWQRSSYFLVAGLPLHGLAYQIIEKRIGVYTAMMLLLVTIVATMQVAGVFRFRRTRRK